MNPTSDRAVPSLLPSILQIILAVLVILVSVAVVLLMVLTNFQAMPGVVSPDGTIGGTAGSIVHPGMTTLIAMIYAVLAVPAVFSLIFTVLRLANRRVASSVNSWGYLAANIGLPLVMLTLVSASMASDSRLSQTFLQPFSLIIAAVVPIWWLVEFAVRRIGSISPQRGWGTLNFTMFVTTPLVVIVEIVLFMIAVMVIAIWFVAQPGSREFAEAFYAKLLQSANNPAELMELYRPFLSNPISIFLLVFSLTILTPLIEEMMKPLGIWILGIGKLEEWDGFVLGALCGAGFALLESLFALPSLLGETQWMHTALGRIGTGAVHITASALIGSSLAVMWKPGSWKRLGRSLLVAVALHGIWNALVILPGISSFLFRGLPNDIFRWISIGGMAVMGFLCITILYHRRRDYQF